MPLFGGKKRGRPKGVKREPKTLKQLLADAFTSELRRNPELMRRVAFKELGHSELLPENEDPVDVRKREIKVKLLDTALDKISKDPELLARFSEKQVAEIVGERPESEEGPEGYYEGGSPIKRALEDIEDYDELKKRLGGGDGSSSGGLGAFLNKEVIVEALKAFREMSRSGQQAAKPEIRYLVQVDGKQQLVSENDFKSLSEQGKLMPVAAISPQVQSSQNVLNKPDTENIKPETPQSATIVTSEMPDVAGVLAGLNLDELIKLLDQPPDEVASMLLNDAKGQLLVTVISGMTYDDIGAKLIPHIEHPTYGKYITRVLALESRPWVEEVLRIIKGEENLE